MQNNYAEIDHLVELVKNKDKDALWLLYDYYKPVINSTVNQISLKYKTIDKEDLISESIFILQDLCVKYEKDKSYFSYFFSTRIQPYLISKIKSKYLEKIQVTDLDYADTLETDHDLNFTINDFTYLHIEIEKLSEKQQQILDLFYFKNLTQAECAVILNVSQPAFNKKLQKVLKILKNNLNN
jgi:RNA polymerase sigma factor (sigma-70 family)